VLFTSTCYTHLSNLPTFSSRPSSLAPNVSTASLPRLLPPPSLLPNLTSALTSNLSLISPDPVRCWCDANRLRIFDPVLVGYRRREELFKDEDEKEKLGADQEEASQRAMVLKEAEEQERRAEELEKHRSRSTRITNAVVSSWIGSTVAWARSLVLSSPSETALKVLAPTSSPPSRWDAERKRLDLRTRGGAAAGVGFVLDFGWGRDETVVKEDLERARVKRRGAILEAKNEERQGEAGS
jgi:hypothetical protein